MPHLNSVLLGVALACLIVFTIVDFRDYKVFKTIGDTHGRQAHYARWVATSFTLFTGGSLLMLAFLGRLGSLVHVPEELEALGRAVAPLNITGHISPSFLIGFAAAVASALIFFTVFALRTQSERAADSNVVALGDIGALIPRNAAEMRIVFLLCLAAGLGEELFFRLTLPILMFPLVGNALIAFGASVGLFGLVHVYQGWAGVLGTALIGAVLTSIYLVTGNLWIVVGLHSLIDINGLLLQPWIRRRLATR